MKENKIKLSIGGKTMQIVDIEDQQVNISLSEWNPHTSEFTRYSMVYDAKDIIDMMKPLVKFHRIK